MRTAYSASPSLEELVAIAPKGRLSHFEVDVRIGDDTLKIQIPGPSSRVSIMTFEGPGEEIPNYFRIIAGILRGNEKRGQWGHYVGLFLGPILAIALPLGIFDAVGRIGLFYDETRPPKDIPGAAISAVVAFLILAPVSAGIWSWTTASFVTLRPVVDPASWLKRMRDRVVGAFTWFKSLYRADELVEQKMLFATVTAALFGVGSFIVALLAWLLPR